MIEVTRTSSMGKAREKAENLGLRMFLRREACEYTTSDFLPPPYQPTSIRIVPIGTICTSYTFIVHPLAFTRRTSTLRLSASPSDHSQPACRLSVIIAILARAYIFSRIRSSLREFGDASLSLSANVHQDHTLVEQELVSMSSTPRSFAQSMK